MAAEGNDWLQQLFLGLPPQLQGVAAVAVGAALFFVVLRRFRASLLNPSPQPEAELIVGDSAKITDMKPVKALTENISLLTVQLMKTEVAVSSYLAGSTDQSKLLLEALGASHETLVQSQVQIMETLNRVADLLGQHLADLRQDREDREDKEREDAARRAGFEEGLAEAKKRRRPTTRRRTATTK